MSWRWYEWAMIYRFGVFELDTARVELRTAGTPSAIEPQVFALVALLVENRERLVTKDEIIEKVWDGRVISDAAVASRVKSARRALGDDGRTQRYIRTVHGRGFRFVAEAQIERDVPDLVSVDVTPAASAAAADRPSIAVLPLRLMGDAGRYAAIAEALPHELIAELSRLRWLFVTARGSSFRLGATVPDMDAVGRMLGVRYCLAGTLEIVRQSLAITVELVDTRDGGVVWADRMTGALDEVHELRSRVLACIIAVLEIRIPLHEASQARLRVTENLDAWSAYHLGLQHLYRFNRADNATAAALFGRAVAQAPDFARAHAGLSFVHFQTAFLRHTDDVKGETDLARRCAERAVELDPIDPFVNFTMGRTYWLVGDLDIARGWLERATSISPNYAHGIYARAWSEALAGNGRVGRELVDRAMRLSPLDPLYYAMLGTRAFSFVAEGNDVEAATWADRAARSPGAHVMIAMIAAVTHALGGDPGRAAAWAGEVRRRNPALTAADFFRSFPMQAESMRTRVAAALARLRF